MTTMSAATKTARALEALIAKWPKPNSRDGRSIAEKLSTVYKDRVAGASTGDGAWKVKRELQAIEDLLNDKYLKEFPRQENTNFSGDVGRRWGYSQLSTESQDKFNKEGFFARMLRHKRPAGTTSSSSSSSSSSSPSSS